MTRAVCFNCGGRKFGALIPCPACGAQAGIGDDMLLSLALTDHFLDAAELDHFSAQIASGVPVYLSEEMRDYMAAGFPGLAGKPATGEG